MKAKEKFSLTPEPFKGSNANLGAPIDWDPEVNGECGSLHVFSSAIALRRENPDAQDPNPYFLSSWKLNFLQRVLVLFTGRINLTVSSHGMPPVAVTCYPNTTDVHRVGWEEIKDDEGLIVGIVMWNPNEAKEVLLGDVARRTSKPRKAKLWERLVAHFAKSL